MSKEKGKELKDTLIVQKELKGYRITRNIEELIPPKELDVKISEIKKSLKQIDHEVEKHQAHILNMSVEKGKMQQNLDVLLQAKSEGRGVYENL